MKRLLTITAVMLCGIMAKAQIGSQFKFSDTSLSIMEWGTTMIEGATGRISESTYFVNRQEYFTVHNFVHVPMGVYADTSYERTDGMITFCVFIDRVLVFRSEFIAKNVNWYKEMYVDKDYLNKMYSLGDTIKHY